MPTVQNTLQQRLSTSLSAQLQQTLHVLNLGAVELIQMIQDQCEHNPFLDREDVLHGHDDVFETPVQTSMTQEDEALNWLENIPERMSVHDNLVQQIDRSFPEYDQRRIAFFLLEHLDEYGYLRVDLSWVAFYFQKTRAQVYEILKILQTFEPAGVFARHLQDVLTLQLKERDCWDPIAEEVVRALCSSDPQQALKQSLKRCPDHERWTRTCSDIQKLTTKPLETSSPQPNDYIIPDLRLRTYGDSWVVEINETFIPRVSSNHVLYQTLRTTTSTLQDQSYVRDLWGQAQNFTQALKQRYRMLVRVAVLIFKVQESFLTQGKQGLQPLTLQDIADTLGMNVSTVSRAVHGKFIQTPQGTYPLKFFFRHAVGGRVHVMTAPYIQEKIQTLIRHEPPQSPLTDQEIAQALKRSHMVISRRTVQKYREHMRIPNASCRRRAWSA